MFFPGYEAIEIFSKFNFKEGIQMKRLTIVCCLALLVFNSTIADAGGKKPKVFGKNVAFGKTVQARGQFFKGGFGTPRVVDFSTLVDGVFFPEGRIFNQGPI